MRGIKRMRGFTRLIVGTALAAAVVGIIPSAGAVSGTGSIAAGQPGTIARGVTETEFRNHRFCGSMPTSQGVDGFIVDLGGTGNTSFSVSGSSAGPFSLNVVFVAPNCVSTTGFFLTTMNNLQKTSISGTVPINSRWMVVSAAYGANISVAYSTS